MSSPQSVSPPLPGPPCPRCSARTRLASIRLWSYACPTCGWYGTLGPGVWRPTQSILSFGLDRGWAIPHQAAASPLSSPAASSWPRASADAARVPDRIIRNDDVVAADASALAVGQGWLQNVRGGIGGRD
jgi:hypothetical protein